MKIDLTEYVLVATDKSRCASCGKLLFLLAPRSLEPNDVPFIFVCTCGDIRQAGKTLPIAPPEKPALMPGVVPAPLPADANYIMTVTLGYQADTTLAEEQDGVSAITSVAELASLLSEWECTLTSIDVRGARQ